MSITVFTCARLRMLALGVVLAFGAPAWAQVAHVDEELPPELSLFKLPKGSHLRVVRNFKSGWQDAPQAWQEHFVYIFTEPREVVREMRVGDEWPVTGLNDKGSYLNISSQKGLDPTFLTMPSKNAPPRVSTVREFHDYYGQYLHLVYHNPANPKQFEGLPDDVVMDLVMAKITMAIKANDYESALPYFAYLESKNANLPESFWYYYTLSVASLKDAERTRTLGNRYLSKYGKKGKYYGKVLELMAQ